MEAHSSSSSLTSKYNITNDKLIKEVRLCRAYPFLFRLDVFPFLVAYFLLLFMSYYGESYRLYAIVLTPIILGCHIVLFFLVHLFVRCKVLIGYKQVHSIQDANHVLVLSAQYFGHGKIVPLLRRNPSPVRDVMIAGRKHDYKCEFFIYEQVKYDYDAQQQTFLRAKYPVQANVSHILQSIGHMNESCIHFCLAKWGYNFFDIPIPMFLDLYTEHISAPFFVFQVLCLFLWSLDDYWYYSMFTLVMLLFFEGMLCKQRQNNLFMLRNMRRPPQPIVTLRCGQWCIVSSEELVPGDVISLSSQPLGPLLNGGMNNGAAGGNGANEAVVIPVDGILLSGSCVVNEAMLTGESIPQVKEPLSAADDVAPTTEVDIGGDINSERAATWKKHTLLSGTIMLQHAADNVGGGGSSVVNGAGSASFHPANGCKVLVMRTGFGTTQGMLMRKILFSADKTVGNQSMETFYFIGILVVFAFIASATVLTKGYYDETRNRFKLILHCIMIITSVIPPELPMELSLAVTTSLAALSKCLVYCTEPQRIALAGKVTTMCFDKTGTLTKDRMMLDGILSCQDVDLFAKPAEEATVRSGTSARKPAPTGTPAGRDDDAEVNSASEAVLAPEKIRAQGSLAAKVVMSACHSLTLQGGRNSSSFVGDPLEVTTFSASGFSFESEHASMLTLPTFVADGVHVQTLHRFSFNSTLKRMSVLVEVTRQIEGFTPLVPVWQAGVSAANVAGQKTWLVVVKGAPEVLASKMRTVPPAYDATSAEYMARGKRVLAMAVKTITEAEAKGSARAKQAPSSSGSVSDSRAKVIGTGASYSREWAESDLTFVGFLVFDCELKSDSKGVVRELALSDHKLVMITGDNPLTAIDVCRRLDFMPTLPTLVLDREKDSTPTKLHWKPASRLESKSSDQLVLDITKSTTSGNRQYNYCLTGDDIEHLVKNVAPFANELAADLGLTPTRYMMKQVCPLVTIFARVTPTQKELIVSAFNDNGAVTLMCGDGTNDVGALKAAHIGISIVNNPEFESKIEKALGGQDSATSATTSSGKRAKSSGNSKDRAARAVAELNAQYEDHSVVKLGDASIASPFTSRRTSIDSVLSVIRQGRATLVTTIQIFKILALNCIVSAFVMSRLYLRGLKQGDTQMTVTGLASALLFFFLSQSKPLHRIASSLPQTSPFQASVMISVGVQSVVHLLSLHFVMELCEAHISPDDPSLSIDGKFQPNIINTSVFLLGMTILVNNFVVNYSGHPFVQSIQENQLLWKSLLALYGSIVIVVGGQVEPLNDALQLTPFPSPAFQAYLLGILVMNFGANCGVEWICRKYGFGKN